MATTDVLVDTGPIVAFFNRRDEHHAWTKAQMARVAVPLYTCEAVLSEATHLLETVPRGVQQLLTFLDRGAVVVPFAYASNAESVHGLMRTYTGQPMSFADACLVRMAEMHPGARVFTTDTDFQVYRASGTEPIDVLIPEAR